MVTFKYNNIHAYVYGTNEEKAIIIDKLSYNRKGSRYYAKEEWQKEASMYHAGYDRFPTGLIPFVLKETEGLLEITLEDGRPLSRDIPLNDISLYNEKTKAPLILHDYQQIGVDKFLENERGIIKLSTGSGKSVVAIAITQKLNRNTLFLCNTKDLLNQTREEYKHKMDIDTGIIGNGNCTIKKVTVATMQSVVRLIKKEPDIIKYLNDIEFLVIDEVHEASKSYRKIANLMVNARWRLGLSATPFMSGKENKFKTLALIGPIIYEVKMKKMVDDKKIAKPTMIFIRNHIDPIEGEWQDIYDQGIVFNEERNLKIAIIALKRLKQGKSSLILIEKTEHGREIENLLKSRCNVKYVHGEHSSKIRKEALQDFSIGSIDVLIASRIFNKGIDIPFLETVIVASGWKSQVLVYQRAGRGVRKTPIKEETMIFDFYDEQWYINEELEHVRGVLFNHSIKRYNTCKKEKAFVLKLITLEEFMKEE